MNAPLDTAPPAGAQTRAAKSVAPIVHQIDVRYTGTHRTFVLKGATRNAELAAAIEAMAALCNAAEPLARAHTAAEEASLAITEEATDEQAAAARGAEQKADERWRRAYRRAERAAFAVMKVSVTDPEDALLQQRAYLYFSEKTRAGEMSDPADFEVCLESAMRALQGLTPPRDTPPPTVDPTVAAYQAARLQGSKYGHGLDPSHGMSDRYDVHDFPTADAMLAAPPVNVAGIAARLGRLIAEGFLHRAGDWDCPICVTRGKREPVAPVTSKELCASAEGENGGLDAFFRALAYLHDGVERLAAQEAASATTTEAWDAAVAKYTAVRSAYDAQAETHTAAWRALSENAAPQIVEPSINQGVAARWGTLSELRNDLLLSDAEKRELQPLVEDLIAKKEAYHAAPERAFEDKADEELYEAVCVAENELLQTQPPHIRALVFKQHLEARERDDDKLGYDDLGFVAYSLDNYVERRDPIILHMDLLRLAGVDHPMLHLEAFSPRQWIKAYEAAGGFVSAGLGGECLLFPAGDETDRLQRELGASSWKYRAVALEASDRRGDGGDPIFCAHGDRGAQDRRGAKPAGPAEPFERVERVTFTLKDGAIAPIVQSLRRQGDRLVVSGDATDHQAVAA